jgi:hypothetical protein
MTHSQAAVETARAAKYDKVKAERDDLIRAMRGVVACFASRTESSTCTEDHHPSCQEYIVSVLKKVEGR